MACYLLRAGYTEKVKIGFAIDIKQRMRELQPGCWERLSLLRDCDGDRIVEGWLHRHFASSRIDREWFIFDPDMMTVAIPDLTHLRVAISSDGSIRSHADVISAFGGVRALAKALGIDPKLATHWPKRGIPAKLWPTVGEVAVQHNVSVTARCLMEMSTSASRCVAA
jgi:Meiotically up-regulated gene 113